MTRRKIHLASDNHLRVLLTEVQPFHVPIIFDNYGFYNSIKALRKRNAYIPDNINKFIFEHFQDEDNYTKTYDYQIIKNSQGSRELSLIHPLQQLQFVEFYKKYKDLIIYNCTKSEFSLRYPTKITSTVYKSNDEATYSYLMSKKVLDGLNQETLDLDYEDSRLIYASTYFSYKRYDFYYKFFESNEFLRLERKFTYLKNLDVSRCFDSIYSHSIAWAIKDKEFTKDNLIRSNKSFEEIFDRLMQKVNYNETNGIVIGSEFSRIFAELIFQKIDLDIQQKLQIEGLIHNRDYAIRRYVDDYSIFTSHLDKEKIVSQVIEDKLKAYNLFINNSKTTHYQRPFVTNRSKNISNLRNLINSEMDKLLIVKKDESSGKKFYLPEDKFRYTSNPQTLKLIKDIKGIWNKESSIDVGFSNYLLKVMQKQVMIFIKNYQYIPNKNSLKKLNISITNFFTFIIETISYAFSLEINVSNSFTFCRTILLIDSFMKKTSDLENYRERVDYKTKVLLIDLIEKEKVLQGVCLVEKINIILTINSINHAYLPDENSLESYLFTTGQEPDYFSLVAGLFLIKNDNKYRKLKKIIFNAIINRLSKLESYHKSSEAMYLLADTLSCPYLDEAQKEEIAITALDKKGIKKNRSQIVADFIQFFGRYDWFITWKELNILSYLKRKRLRDSY